MIKKIIPTITLVTAILAATLANAGNYSYNDYATSNLFKSYSSYIPAMCTVRSNVTANLYSCDTWSCPPVPSITVQSYVMGPQGGGQTYIYLRSYAGGSSSDSFQIPNKVAGNYSVGHIVSFSSGGSGFASLNSVIDW